MVENTDVASGADENKFPLRNKDGYYKNVESFKCKYEITPGVANIYKPSRPADYDFPCSTPGCTRRNR